MTQHLDPDAPDHDDDLLALDTQATPTADVADPFQPVQAQGASDALDPELLRIAQGYTIPIARYFRTSIRGIERLPRDQGCLCVSNHTMLGIDVIAMFTQTYLDSGRMMRGLGARQLFKLPVAGDLLRKLGAVEGTRANAIAMLKRGEWAVCYPGGVRESFKTSRVKYRLLWDGRMGYLRCALAAGVPIVPIAGIGIDDAFVTVGNERWIGRRLLGKDFDLPIFVGMGIAPMPVKFTFWIDHPIDLRARFGLGPEHANAPDAELLEAHTVIWGQTQALIQAGLARRVNRFVG